VTSALELIGEAIDALMRADAARLERLAKQAPSVPLPQTESQRRELARNQRTLAHLLTLTRRNLRILGGLRGEAGRFEEGRG
jgi:hypothetical protein